MAYRNNRSSKQTSTKNDAPAYKEVFAVIDRGEQSFWTRIGVAFPNKDGSLNIKLNLIPTDPEATIQVRDPRPRDEE